MQVQNNGLAGTITVNGVVYSLSSLIILGSRLDATHLSAFRKANGGVSYTPSGSNKFQAIAVEVASSAAANFDLEYMDNDIGWYSTSALTNNKFEYLGSATQPLAYRYNPSVLSTAVLWATQFQIPNGKYSTVTFDSGTPTAFVRLYGFETA